MLRSLIKQLHHRVMKTYADWRVGATREEKFAYRTADSILLTFDDYGTREQLEQILGILHDRRVRAVFFLQGDWAGKHPQLVELVRSHGHEVANHTYSHPNLLTLSDEEVLAEISGGLPGPWLRPPQGRYDARIRRLAHSLDKRICYWTIDSDDWQGLSAPVMSRKILAQLHPGAVILFHAHAKHTPEVLSELIDTIRSRGYRLCGSDEPVWPEGV